MGNNLIFWQMISAEAPVLFAKAAQIFITELTLRAWIHTEDNKRRTLQRNDIAMAITKFDQFDFLIDIVPRDELKPPKRQEEVRQAVTPAEPVQYYFTLAQQPAAVQVQGQQQGQQTTTATTTIQPGQIIIAQPQQGQTTPVTMQVGEGQQVQIVQAQPQGQSQQAQSSTGQTMQVMQQIITNTGEIQQIPVQLNAGQLQYIRLAQPVSGTQVVQGQIQTLATNAQQVSVRGACRACWCLCVALGEAPAASELLADNADGGAAGAAAVQPVHRWTAAVPDPAGDNARGPGHHPAHVHPVHQPELGHPGHAGDRGLSRDLVTSPQIQP
uniref:Nuclear transcription factor Y subunit gamma n=1 Tax=Serinus canaria TaxID=9135 RepID=A0A8C9NLM2_SERCA